VDPHIESRIQKNQLPHWETIQWLLNPESKGTGRSTLLALGFVSAADQHLGKVVHLWDHHSSNRQDADRMTYQVQTLVATLQKHCPVWAKKVFEVSKANFTIKRTA
jgi:hypothetical protein